MKKEKSNFWISTLVMDAIPGAGHLPYLAVKPYNLTIAFILLIIILVIAAAFAAIWGILVLLGILLISTAILVIILNRGSQGVNIGIFYVALFIGIIFIFMDLAGVELGTVDLSTWPVLQDVYYYFHP